MQTSVNSEPECTRRESVCVVVGLELLPVAVAIAVNDQCPCTVSGDSTNSSQSIHSTPPFYIVSSIGVESAE